MPTTFKGDANPENSAQLKVGEFFNDPVLARLIDQALAGNLELKILNEEVVIARNELLARRGSYLPFFNLGASAGTFKPSLYTFEGALEEQNEITPGRAFPDPLPNYAFGLKLFWDLDIWRELRNARDAAAQRYVAAVERRNYFVTRLIADIADNYYQLMALDRRLENLNTIIQLQERSLKYANKRFELSKTSVLPVRRFEAEIRKNRSLIVITQQDIIQVENNINFLVNRYPQPVERNAAQFYNLTFPLRAGVPAQLLQYRPDIRQAERDLVAAGLDVKVARAHFFPKVAITGDVGTAAFNPKYLFTPQSLIGSIAGDLMVPLINKRAIRAEYRTANAKQLQAVYNYQRVILNAFTQVINRMAKVQNYSRSVTLKQQQVQALDGAVRAATLLYENPRLEEKEAISYIDVLFAQRDLVNARLELVDTRQQQLSAVVNAYQALGGGALLLQGGFPTNNEKCPPFPGRRRRFIAAQGAPIAASEANGATNIARHSPIYAELSFDHD